MKPGLCTALYTTASWPVCHYLYNGPYCAFAGLDKVPCVPACVYTGAKDTPGAPRAPGTPLPEPGCHSWHCSLASLT